MSKIFNNNTPSEPHKKNPYKRTQNIQLGFRATPAERDMIFARIETLGMSRQSFFVQSTLEQEVRFIGNIKTFAILDDKMNEIIKKLELNPRLDSLDPEHAVILLTILQILDSMRNGDKK